MKIACFEDINAWKEARQLVKEVYFCFKECRDFAFRDQIQRAALSVMANIAEGFDRGSNRENIQFLTIARGSLSEVKSIGYAALDIGYLNQNNFEILCGRCTRISNLLNGFIRYLRVSERKH